MVAAPEKWTLRGLFTVAFLGIAAGVQLSDMGLQAISLSAIQNTFKVSDATLGALQGLAGVLVGSALAIPLARFADRYARKRVLLCLIAASTAMMVLSALAPTFPLFFIGRSAAGITEFAMVPLVYSMIPDLAPERDRVTANLSFAALMAAGASGGFFFAGSLLSAAESLPWAIEPWRKAFLLLSCSGLPLLLLCTLTIDPPRHADTATLAVDGSLASFLRRRWQAIGLFAGTAGFLVIAVQAINQLISLALERRFNASPGDIGQAMGFIILTAAVGCLPVAGLLDRILVKRLGHAVRPLLMGACALVTIPVALSLSAVATLDHALVAVGTALFVTSTANALVPTMLQDLTPPALRARSFAIWSFVVSVFGAAGPLLAGLLSDRVFDGHLLNAIVLAAAPALVLSALCALRACWLAYKEQPHGAGPGV